MPTMYSVIMSMGPLFGWSSYIKKSDNINCSIDLSCRNFNLISYASVYFATGIILPFNVVLITNFLVFRKVKQSSKKLFAVNSLEREKSQKKLAFVKITTLLISSVFLTQRHFCVT